MEDTLISFETAKLAKEKGFDWKVEYCFYDEFTKQTILKDKPLDYSKHKKGKLYEYISTPTQSLLQRWLREIHNINIFISSKTIENKTIFIPHGRTIPDSIKNNLIVDIIQYCTNNTYEDALEKGLQEALKLIK